MNKYGRILLTIIIIALLAFLGYKGYVWYKTQQDDRKTDQVKLIETLKANEGLIIELKT